MKPREKRGSKNSGGGGPVKIGVRRHKGGGPGRFARAKAKAGARRTARRREDRRDPPRSAWARIDAPLSVTVGEEFSLTVGLSEEKQSGVSGGQILRPETSYGPYQLEVEVTAPEFDKVIEDESWTNTLDVTADSPYPAFSLQLVARKQSKALMHPSIEVVYSLDGVPLARAKRQIEVARSDAARSRSPLTQEAADVTLSLPRNIPAADMTVMISLLDNEKGSLLWRFKVGKGITVDRPETGLKYPIGHQPEKLANRLTGEMTKLEREGIDGKYALVHQSGKKIANAMPPQFWEVLRAVAERVRPRLPTVQLLIEDPRIPIELATFPAPLLDPTSPPFLGAQVPIARWVMGSVEDPRPTWPPPTQVRTTRMSVVYGDYPVKDGFEPLVDSIDEAKGLMAVWRAKWVDAKSKVVLKKLVEPGADVVHFACHGNFDETGVLDGLLMADGKCVLPEEISFLKFGRRRPFVFLNACQTGRASLLLNDYAGMAQAFLQAGASGVIAPLWSVSDKLSGEIAGRFYDRAYDGDLPAEVLRDERRRFRLKGKSQPQSGTWMAYVFYGHPRAHFAAKKRRERRPKRSLTGSKKGVRS